jgi:hypothetical protein
MENWKRLTTKAVRIGAGLALLAMLTIGAAVWWSKNAVNQKPWNADAITASFYAVTTQGDGNDLVFVYTMQNNTDADYRVADGGAIHLASRLMENDSLSFDTSRLIVAEYPIHISAHSRMRFLLHSNYRYPTKEDVKASEDIRHDWETTICKYVSDEFKNLNGFVLMDDNSRYQVNLPNGWTARAKDPLRVKPVRCSEFSDMMSSALCSER